MIKKLIIRIILTLIISISLTWITVRFLNTFTVDESVKSDLTGTDKARLLLNVSISYILYFFALLCLPLLWKSMKIIQSFKKNILWKVMIGAEIIVVAISVFLTPPDFFSSIMSFIILQPVVAINIISIKKSQNNTGDI